MVYFCTYCLLSICEMCSGKFLNQYIDVPTREDAILDLQLGNELGQVTKVCVGNTLVPVIITSLVST